MYDNNDTPLIHAVCLGATIFWIHEAGPHTGCVAGSEVGLFKCPWAIHWQSLHILWGSFSEWGKNVLCKDASFNLLFFFRLHSLIRITFTFHLKNVAIARISWNLGEKKGNEISLKLTSPWVALALSSIYIFVGLFTYAVLSQSTDSVKGASFNNGKCKCLWANFPSLWCYWTH